MLSISWLLNGDNYAGYIEWSMLLKKFGCEDIMTIYAMYRERFRAEAMAKRYKAHGYEVDICELEFKGSYEV